MPGNNHYPSCTCGWCIGGWLGRTFRRSIPPTPPHLVAGTVSRWDDSGDCCRKTTCPTCGQAVFFVRHNGGSVWFDALGQPWPIHSCFDSGPVVATVRTRLADRELGRRVVMVGVFVETVVTHPGNGGDVVVAFGDDEMFEENIVASADLTKLPGELVLVALGDDGQSRLHLGSGLLQRGGGVRRWDGGRQPTS